jgi:hypothetical protein
MAINPVLSWAFSYKMCAVPMHPVADSSPPPCTFWLVLDANTGEMIQGRWQQGT